MKWRRQMNRAAIGVLGIDLGGTKITAGIVDPAAVLSF
jgi:predicted NBD/HSP70 family sugar kinase